MLLISEKNVLMDDETKLLLHRYMGGYRRMTAKLRQNGSMPIREGKLQLCLDG